VLFLAFGVLFTWPLARHLDTDVLYTHEAAPGYERVPLAQGDHLHLLYIFWLFGDSVREGRSLLGDPYQFHGAGPEGFFFQPSLLPVLTALLSPLGLVAAFNVLALLSFPATGLAAYLLLRLGTTDRLAALGGAAVVALFPYRVAQLAGHANGFLAFLVPLYLYFFERSLRSARWVGWTLAAGAAFFFSGAMEFHIVYYLTLFLGAYLPFRFLFPLADWLEPRRTAASGADGEARSHLLALAGGAGLGIAVYGSVDRVFHFGRPAGWLVTALFFAGLAWLLWRGLVRFALAYLALPGGFARGLATSLAPLALLALAPLGGRYAIGNFGRMLLAAALAAAAATLVPVLRRSGGVRWQPGAPALLRARGSRFLLHLLPIGLTLVFLLVVKKLVFSESVSSEGRLFSDVTSFSPGPRDLLLPVNGSGEKLVYLGAVALLLALAGALATRRIADPRARLAVGFFGGTFALGTLLAVGPHLDLLPLYHLLYKTVPLFNSPRVTGRILIIAVVGLAVLVTTGLAALRARRRRPAAVLALLLLALLAADYLPRRRPGLTTLPAGHPVYDAIARERAPGETILELPIWPGPSSWSSVYLWYATRYREPILNGYSPATPRDYVGSIFQPLYPLDFGEMRRPQFDLLRRLGIRFIVFHDEVYPPKISDYPPSLATANLAASPYLEAVSSVPPLHLFRLRAEPPAEEPSFTRASPVGSIYEGERWSGPRGVRTDDPLASGGAVASFPPGAGGVISRTFPRRVYPTGSYRIRARFLVDAARPGATVSLAVKESGSGRALGGATGTAAPDEHGLFDLVANVALESPTSLDCELSASDAGQLRWDFLAIGFAAEPEPQLAFEIEDLWNLGQTLADPGASAGAAVQLVPGHHPPDFAFAGPDRVLPAGRWVAELRYRAAPGGAAGGEFFEVAVSNQPGPLARVPLPDTGDAGWRTVSLPFTLARSAPLRFRAFFASRRELVLDRLAISAQGDAPPP
jgi:hypothetical protein